MTAIVQTFRSSGNIVDRAVRATTAGLLWLTVIVMLLPVVMVLILSFGTRAFIEFPPSQWGFDQYAKLFEAGSPWVAATLLSFRVALPAALIATAVGIAAALAITRTQMPGGTMLRFAGLSSLIIPASAYAVAVWAVYAQLGLLGSYVGLVVIHAVLGIPVVLLIATAALDQIPQQLELAAMSLGEKRFRVWIEITLRIALPSLAAAFLFALILSFDESVLVIFLGGPGLVTLPAAIFAAVTVGLDPVVNAIATVLIAITAVLMGAALLVRNRART